MSIVETERETERDRALDTGLNVDYVKVDSEVNMKYYGWMAACISDTDVKLTPSVTCCGPILSASVFLGWDG